MYTMRKLIILLLCCTLLLPIIVFAHPGQTDESGGHVYSDTDEYHYHHGYSAHDHYDMDGDGDVDCPYDFNDLTGINSGGQSEYSSSNRYDNDGNVIVKAETGTKTISKEDPYIPSWIFWIIGLLIFVCIIQYIIIRFHKSDIQDWEERYRSSLADHKNTVSEIENTYTSKIEQDRVFNESQTHKLNQKIRSLDAENSALKNDLRAQDNKIRTILSIINSHASKCKRDTIGDLLEDVYNGSLQIPNNIFFLDDGTPASGSIDSRRPYGDLTVFVARNGKCYHRDFYCSGAGDSKHAYRVIGRMPPCKKCATGYFSEIPAWYIRLKKAKLDLQETT